MTEAQLEVEAKKIAKEITRQEIQSWFLDEMIDNQLRLLLNELMGSETDRKVRFLLRRGLSSVDILKEAKEAKKIVVGFHKKCPTGHIIKSISYDTEIARVKATAVKRKS
jgi:hypothetical protein